MRVRYTMRMEYKEALGLGLKRYNTGRPCFAGHLSDRRTSTRGCIECFQAYQKIWVEKNRDRVNALNRKSRSRRGGDYNARVRVRMRAYYRKRAGLPEPPYH